MYVSASSSSLTMIFLISVLLTLTHHAQAFCPTHCKCTLEGTTGVNAYCTSLYLDEQFFLKPVQHLTIANENKTQLSLTDSIFAKLGLKRLESIKIVKSNLSNIDVNAFRDLTALFDVNLSDNDLFLIHPDTFTNNTNLHRLKLSGNPLQLTQLLETPHEYLLRSSSLTELDISFCQLSQILPLTFSQLKNLIFVNLSFNFLKNIPKNVFSDLIYLEELDLSDNQISKIDKDTFKDNVNLSVLKLRKNPIDYFTGINAPKLSELDLSECKLRVLMREILQGMPQLIQINFSYNKIEILSEDTFFDLMNLKHLDLSHNDITGPLPQNIIKNNYDLESLILTGNSELRVLVEDPAGFTSGHLSLIKLEVGSCGLTSLGHGQLAGFDNLEILIANNNSIKHLNSSTFGHLKRLNHLDLSDNFIEVLDPHLFINNTELVKLKISGNPIIELPVFTFVPISNLKWLDVSDCQLIRFWDNHKHALKPNKVLSNLEHLDISDNNIKNLHVYDFSTMEKLEKVDLSKNPLECVKPTIEVIEWFMTKQVDTYHPGIKNPEGGDDKILWTELINEICPIKNIDDLEPTEVQNNDENHLSDFEKNQNFESSGFVHRLPTYDLKEIIVESRDDSIMWSIIFIGSVLIIIVYLICYFIGEITSRRRTLAAYMKPGSFGGAHIRTKASGNAPLYYKLYEECSVPTQPAPVKKGGVLIGFAPIHALLKKGSYRIMKNEEVNV